MIRKILVPVRGDGKGDNVLAHAAALAHRSDAHLEVVHCRPRPEDLMPYGIAIPDFLKKQVLKQSYEVADQEEAGLRRELEVLAGKLKLDHAQASIGKAATVAFVEERGQALAAPGQQPHGSAGGQPDSKNLPKRILIFLTVH